MSTTLNFEAGSYRDRDGRIFLDESGAIYRTLSSTALAEWRALEQTGFFKSAVQAKRLIATQECDPDNELRESIGNWAGCLQHEVVPFVTYPFEWSFGMLRDAALLHLELLSDALNEDFTFKDGTAYNVQWFGTTPIFIDIVSLERWKQGSPWAGYRQFCQTFLYPLFLQAYKNRPFHPWLRGRLDGITPEECRSLMSFRDLFRRGVASHVMLHAWLQSRRSVDEVDTSKALQSAGFHKDLIRANVQGLRKVIRRLKWTPQQSKWSDYAEDNSYSEVDRQSKAEFVKVASRTQWHKLVWDLGCNTGTYSRIASENSDLVIAMDADHLAIERLYQSLKLRPPASGGSILPLVSNVVDPACGLGWRGLERKRLEDRGRPSLILFLALIHHLVIGHGVPLHELLEWLAELGGSLIIEFVSKDDPMVQRLLRGRVDNYTDYTQSNFEQLLSQKFHLVRREALASGTRTLYFAEARRLS